MANPFANRANAAANQAPAPAATPEPAPVQEQPAATGQVPPTPAKSLSDMFNNGALAGGDKIQDLEGHAVLIRTNEVRKDMNTRNGVTDAIGADWIALDGPNQGQEFNGLIFGKVIVSSLETYFNQGQRLCVGIIEKGEAKPGKNAPWLLNPLNEQQLELAGQAVQALGWA